MDVAYPFFLELFDDFMTGILSEEAFIGIVRLTESYLFRRGMCSLPTNSLNTIFSRFSKKIDKDHYLENVQASYLMLKGNSKFPLDKEFIEASKNKNLYKFGFSPYWLYRLENDDNKEPIKRGDYSIEHILPQNENVSNAWKQALGENWKKIHEEKLHSLGNLTLTGYNSELKDYPFAKKRDDEIFGFCSSNLKLNKGLCKVEQWNEQAIDERAEKLAQKFPEIWAVPSLPEEVLANYQPESKVNTSYDLSNHPHLLSGKTKELFEAFRKEVLALDPSSISEEFTKLYVAYKAETNFVDAVPQAQGLRLSLNMAYPEISDPEEKCKDISNVGRWGNGDVEVRLKALKDLPYVIGLVRQSLEKQLGNGENE